MEERIRINYVFLTDELQPLDEVWTHLRQEDIFSDDDIQKAKSRETPREQTIQTLRILIRKDPNSLNEKFIDILEKCRFKHVADILRSGRRSEERGQPTKQFPTEINSPNGARNEEYKIRIGKKLSFLVARLDPTPFLQCYLVQEGVMNFQDLERLDYERTSSDRAKTLLGIILDSNQTDIYPCLILMNGLYSDSQTRYLVNELNEGQADVSLNIDPHDSMLRQWLNEKFIFQPGSHVTLAQAMCHVQEKCRQGGIRSVWTDMRVANVLCRFDPSVQLNRTNDHLYFENVGQQEAGEDEQNTDEQTHVKELHSGDDETRVKQMHLSANNQASNRQEFQLKEVDPVVYPSPSQPDESGDGWNSNARMEDWDVDCVCQWLKHLQLERNVRIPSAAIDIFRKEDIDGLTLANLSIDELGTFCPSLQFGPKKRIVMFRDQFLSKESAEPVCTPGISKGHKSPQSSPDSRSLLSRQHLPEHMNSAELRFDNVIASQQSVGPISDVTEDAERSIEYFRAFDKPAGVSDRYIRDSKLPAPGVRPENLLTPVHRYVDVDLAVVEENQINRVMWEIVKFSAACLNDRTNGTLHLGITKAGLVRGTRLPESLPKFDERVDKNLRRCFFPEQHSTVLTCIRPLKLVQVTPSAGTTLYVIEIDVVPVWEICHSDAFFVRKPVNSQYSSFDEPLLYRLESMEPTQVNPRGVSEFMEFKVKISKRRRDVEQQQIFNPENKEMARRLSDILYLDDEHADIYRILVLNAPISCSNDERFFEKNLKFISLIDWKLIMDFDPEARLCRYMDEVLHEQIRVITATDDFDPRNPSNRANQDRLKHLHDDILQGRHTPWIFANGHLPSNVESMDKAIDWKQLHSQGFIELVRFISNQIPPGRAMITFLLLSKPYDVMLEGADRLCTSFPQQWVFIAETEKMTRPWLDQLQNRNTINLESSGSHVITDIPWDHLQKIVQQKNRLAVVSSCVLPTSYGSGQYVDLDEKKRRDMSDLEILSSRECDDVEYDEDRMQREEVAFYRGQQVSWWNLWSSDQVLRRSIHDQLYRIVSSRLEGRANAGDGLSFVFLHHQPGAGGSTTARHILWDFRKLYRCAVIRQITEDTINQIMQFREHQDKAPNPVFLLLDNYNDENVVKFLVALEEECKRLILDGESFKTVCVILSCKRVSKLKDISLPSMISLKQKLESHEKEWFKKTNKRLKDDFEKGKKGDPGYLLSFNIMRENFDEEFIRDCVRRFLKDIESEKERLILKYIALIDTFQLTKSVIPTAAFDTLMIDIPYKKGFRRRQKAIATRWESNLSEAVHMLLAETSLPGMGEIKGLGIINSLVSRVILENTSPVPDAQQSVSSIAMEFLENDDIFGSRSIATDKLQDILKNLMKRRERGPDDRPKTKFAPLIQEIVDKENVDAACALLVLGFAMTEDPFIAQQIARLYIHSQNWPMAEEYATKAYEMLPNNSYLLDTLGQVFKAQLESRYSRCMNLDALSPNEAIEVLVLARSAIGYFKKEQRANDEDDSTSLSNLAGFHGELDSVIHLLNCLTYLDPLRNIHTLKRFLVEEEFIPDDLQRWKNVEDSNWIYFCKGLKEDVTRCLIRLEDEILQLREEVPGDFQSVKRDLNVEKLRKEKRNITEYFGETRELNPAQLDVMDEAAVCLYNRRHLLYNDGTSFLGIFDLRKMEDGEHRIKAIQKIALQNVGKSHYNAQDLLTLISANLALHHHYSKSCQRGIDHKQMVSCSQTLYEMRNQLQNIQLEPYMFYVMLNWPSKGRSNNESPCAIKEAVKQWHAAYLEKYPRQRVKGNRIRKKDATIFFLARGTEMNSLVSHAKLKSYTDQRNQREFWELPKVKEICQRFSGWLVDEGKEVILTVDHHGSTNMTLPTSFPIRNRSIWNKKVYFVIGFSWIGPKAFDISSSDPTADVSFSDEDQYFTTIPARVHSKPKYPLHIVTHAVFSGRMARLKDKLKEIERLRAELKKSGREPNEAEAKLLDQEEELQKNKEEMIKQREHALSMYND